MIEHIFARVADKLQSVAPCFVGDPPDNVAVPFLFVWGRFPIEHSEILSGKESFLDSLLYVQVVDKQPPDVMLLAGEAKRALHGWEPNISGWQMFPLKVVSSTPEYTDRGSVHEESNTFPAWLTLTVRVRGVQVSV